jgi:DNA-binding Lrp family transcriptional regulator
MADNTDSGDGRPREYSENDVLTALQELDDGSGVRTGEVADMVGCSPRTALRRLTSLEDSDKAESVAVTERMKLWHIADE